MISILEESYIKSFFADFTYLLPKSNLLSLFFGILFTQMALGGEYFFFILMNLDIFYVVFGRKKGVQPFRPAMSLSLCQVRLYMFRLGYSRLSWVGLR
jgi:hypothetical protein